MAENVKKNKKPFNWSLFWEIFWLCLFGIFFVGGVVFGILGVYCNNVQWVTNDALYNSQNHLPPGSIGLSSEWSTIEFSV